MSFSWLGAQLVCSQVALVYFCLVRNLPVEPHTTFQSASRQLGRFEPNKALPKRKKLTSWGTVVSNLYMMQLLHLECAVKNVKTRNSKCVFSV